ncbi:MAG: hypothetical protein LBH00_02520 [Planctomycetaceae bacterium]|nr:hypothetical protein [Planctomycetaceae bacterium]
MRTLTILTLLIIVTLFSVSCSRKPDRGTVPVKVTIRYNGEPVNEAIIVFSSPQHYASGLTDKSGVAEMETFTLKDGAIPDEYKVAVSKTELIEKLDTKKPAGENVISSETKYHIPAKYSTAETSGLTVNVTKEGKNEFVFELE